MLVFPLPKYSELRDNILNQFENYVPLRGIDFEMDAEETNWKLGVPLKRTEKKLKVTKPPGFQVRKEGKEVKLGRGRGILDENIRQIESYMNVKISNRGNAFTIKGSKSNVPMTSALIEKLYSIVKMIKI